MPHGTGIEIIQYKEPAKRGGVTSIEANIYCEKATHKGIIIGKGGKMIKHIGTLARKDIENYLGKRVNLATFVRVEEEWRNSSRCLKEFGYNDK